MGTRSAIGVYENEKVTAVYCHWDGYISHNGKILNDHYNVEKTKQLVALGDLSSLRPNVVARCPQQHSFDSPERDVCVFYGRDRGETDVRANVVDSADQLFNLYGHCEYFYVIKDNIWYVSEGPGTPWRLLAEEVGR